MDSNIQYESYSKEDIHSIISEVAHSDYFTQFEETVKENFKLNEELTLYRTCQEFPCNENDNEARIFRKKNGQNPVPVRYSDEELDGFDEKTKLDLVTKGCLSFNTTPEAAVKSAKHHDRKLKKEKQSDKKRRMYRKDRGILVGRFIFPKGTVLVTEVHHEHLNVIKYRVADIENFRDTSFRMEINYDEDEES